MSGTLRTIRWDELTAAERDNALCRPVQRNETETLSRAGHIVHDVRARGDLALKEYTEQLDGVRLDSFQVGRAEFESAYGTLSEEQLAALKRAIATVTKFHQTQSLDPVRLETAPGVTCERLMIPMAAVGLYVPAGTAPLPSTAIMLAIPARLAGCPQRIICTPPRADGTADPAVLVAAELCGVSQVFKLGGAQAVGAMAYGTESVPKVDKIFGPGNSWVTAAKQIVAADAGGASLDMPAGPSEVLVIADATARADFVAADLLAQAEHSVDAQVVLVTTEADLAASVIDHVASQMARLPRKDITERSIASSRVILVSNLEAAFDVSNRYAPEHLILQIDSPRQWLPRVRSAGSVFLGHWTPETMGDYCSGTNHVLPTYGHARAYSGLGVIDFVKRMTVQEVSPEGIADLGLTARTLARLESLDGHANAITIRLEALQNGASQ